MRTVVKCPNGAEIYFLITPRRPDSVSRRANQKGSKFSIAAPFTAAFRVQVGLHEDMVGVCIGHVLGIFEFSAVSMAIRKTMKSNAGVE